MEKKIAALTGHHIICAAHETGLSAIEEFHKTGRAFVVISNDAHVILPKIKDRQDILYLHGEAADDETLKKGGVERAAGLIAVTGEDRENLFIVMSTRQLNPKLRIVSQAINRSSIPKLKKAGADEVVSTTEIGGMRIASSMVRPTVVNFLDKMLYADDKVLRIEEAEIPEKSPVAGKELAACEIPKKTGLLVIAIKNKSTGSYEYNPSGGYIINPGDILVLLGEVEKLKLLSGLIGS